MSGLLAALWEAPLALVPSFLRPVLLSLAAPAASPPTFEDDVVLPPDLPVRERELLRDLFSRHQRRPSRALLGRLLAFALFFTAVAAYLFHRCVRVEARGERGGARGGRGDGAGRARVCRRRLCVHALAAGSSTAACGLWEVSLWCAVVAGAGLWAVWFWLAWLRWDLRRLLATLPTHLSARQRALLGLPGAHAPEGSVSGLAGAVDSKETSLRDARSPTPGRARPGPAPSDGRASGLHRVPTPQEAALEAAGPPVGATSRAGWQEPLSASDAWALGVPERAEMAARGLGGLQGAASRSVAHLLASPASQAVAEMAAATAAALALGPMLSAREKRRLADLDPSLSRLLMEGDVSAASAGSAGATGAAPGPGTAAASAAASEGSSSSAAASAGPAASGEDARGSPTPVRLRQEVEQAADGAVDQNAWGLSRWVDLRNRRGGMALAAGRVPSAAGGGAGAVQMLLAAPAGSADDAPIGPVPVGVPGNEASWSLTAAVGGWTSSLREYFPGVVPTEETATPWATLPPSAASAAAAALAVPRHARLVPWDRLALATGFRSDDVDEYVGVLRSWIAEGIRDVCVRQLDRNAALLFERLRELRALYIALQTLPSIPAPASAASSAASSYSLRSYGASAQGAAAALAPPSAASLQLLSTTAAAEAGGTAAEDIPLAFLRRDMRAPLRVRCPWLVPAAAVGGNDVDDRLGLAGSDAASLGLLVPGATAAGGGAGGLAAAPASSSSSSSASTAGGAVVGGCTRHLTLDEITAAMAVSAEDPEWVCFLLSKQPRPPSVAGGPGDPLGMGLGGAGASGGFGAGNGGGGGFGQMNALQQQRALGRRPSGWPWAVPLSDGAEASLGGRHTASGIASRAFTVRASLQATEARQAARKSGYGSSLGSYSSSSSRFGTSLSSSLSSSSSRFSTSSSPSSSSSPTGAGTGAGVALSRWGAPLPAATTVEERTAPRSRILWADAGRDFLLHFEEGGRSRATLRAAYVHAWEERAAAEELLPPGDASARAYALHRLRELAQDSELGIFAGDVGGRVGDAEWSDRVPSDGQLVLQAATVLLDRVLRTDTAAARQRAVEARDAANAMQRRVAEARSALAQAATAAGSSGTSSATGSSPAPTSAPAASPAPATLSKLAADAAAADRAAQRAEEAAAAAMLAVARPFRGRFVRYGSDLPDTRDLRVPLLQVVTTRPLRLRVAYRGALCEPPAGRKHLFQALALFLLLAQHALGLTDEGNPTAQASRERAAAQGDAVRRVDAADALRKQFAPIVRRIFGGTAALRSAHS